MPVSSTKHLVKQGLLAISCLFLSACYSEQSPVSGDTVSEPPGQKVASEALDTQTAKPALSLRQDLASSAAQAFAAAKQLANKVQEFSHDARQENLQHALDSWEHAHMSYLLAKSLIVPPLQHPVLDQGQTEPSVIHPITIRLDQFPMINGYLDAVPGYPKSGLMHSETTLSLESLNTEHQFSDPSYVALGFHALKFMLSDDSTSAEGLAIDSKSRLNDYTLSSPEPEGKALDDERLKTVLRRKRYLKLLTEQIVSDIGLINQEWQSEEGYYHRHFSAFKPQDSKHYLGLLEAQHKQRVADMAEGNPASLHFNADAIEASARRLNDLKSRHF